MVNIYHLSIYVFSFCSGTIVGKNDMPAVYKTTKEIKQKYLRLDICDYMPMKQVKEIIDEVMQKCGNDARFTVSIKGPIGEENAVFYAEWEEVETEVEYMGRLNNERIQEEKEKKERLLTYQKLKEEFEGVL